MPPPRRTGFIARSRRTTTIGRTEGPRSQIRESRSEVPAPFAVALHAEREKHQIEAAGPVQRLHGIDADVDDVGDDPQRPVVENFLVIRNCAMMLSRVVKASG